MNSDPTTKKVLLVDDDPLVRLIYRDGLARYGFEVEAAADGLEALKVLAASKPDVVVLDLMMPKFTGVDVLRFIRSKPEIARVPVVVLSNSYMNDLSNQAEKVGVERSLLKTRCSPPVLASVINDVLVGEIPPDDTSFLVPASKAQSPTPPAPAIRPVTSEAAASAKGVADNGGASEFLPKIHRDFLTSSASTCEAIRSLCRAFTNADSDAQREVRLEDFYRKIHYVTATAGLAQCHEIALLSSAFEALLFELIKKPAFISDSVLRTATFTADFLSQLFDAAREVSAETPLSAKVLVVDDDAISNRLVVVALKRAELTPRSTEDPVIALQWLEKTQFDLVLLDIEMPGMDGYELCQKLRSIKGYEKTPVIFVTSHSDFASQVKSVESGGNDLIAKPVFPLELAVKAVTHLLKSRLAQRGSATVK
jgi:CheY-like chemotaxis protein